MTKYVEIVRGGKVAKYSEWLVVPVVVGGLGTVLKDAERYIKSLPGGVDMTLCQKIAVLGSKRILQAVLSRKD